MPPIPELPEGSAALTSDPEVEQTDNCDTVDGSKEGADDAQPLLESHAKIAGQRKVLFTLLSCRIENVTKEKEK